MSIIALSCVPIRLKSVPGVRTPMSPSLTTTNLEIDTDYCWDWGEVCPDIKGPVEAGSSEFVEIELYYQEGGEEMLTLRGEAAQIARETLGGKWEAKMQVEVLFFDDGDKNCRVKARE